MSRNLRGNKKELLSVADFNNVDREMSKIYEGTEKSGMKSLNNTGP